MADQQNGGEAARRIIVLRGVDSTEVAWWADARTIDAQAFEWAEVQGVVRQRSGDCDVTLAISAAVFEELTDGIKSKRDIEDALRSAPYETATEIIEEDHLNCEAEGIPPCSAGTVFGPLTVVAEWTILQAHDVNFWISDSTGDTACVELVRLGRMGEASVTVAVTLPVSIFDAAITIYRRGRGKRMLNDCVLDAMAASYAEQMKPDEDFGDDHIPF